MGHDAEGTRQEPGITQAELDGWMIIGEEKAKYTTEVLRDVYKAGGKVRSQTTC